MKTVHKFPLQTADIQVLNMPIGATILHAALDSQGALCLWAFVDTEKPSEDRAILITGTGYPVPDDLMHIGSVVQGPFVWHVWEQC